MSIATSETSNGTISHTEVHSALEAAIGAYSESESDGQSMYVNGMKLDFAEIAAHVVTIGPEDAARLLSRNTRNRSIKLPNLNKIITDLNNGNYTYNGSSIVISTAGSVLDGQHRLAGVVLTGVAIQSVITTGVVPEAQGDMDSGKVRTLAENLELRGETNGNQLSAVLVGIQAWDRGERGNETPTGLTTNNTSLTFLGQHPELRDLTNEAYPLAARIPGLTGKQVAQLIWAFDKLSVDDRKDFFEKLDSGTNLEEGNPVLVLRNFLQKESQSASKVSSYHRTALVCKAWNQYRGGSRGKLTFKPGGANPEGFPEPI
jgi:hypothetical protein